MESLRLKKFFSSLFIISFVLFSFSACAKKKIVKKTIDTDELSDEVDSDELDTHGKDFVASKNLGTIYFNYDSSELSDETRKTLSINSAYLKKNKKIEILTEGHCDDRGTISYNLALGQKRATSVRNYYLSLGIDPERMGSLSYGKEKPSCNESTEECWVKNRRVETKIRLIKKNQEDESPEKEQSLSENKKPK